MQIVIEDAGVQREVDLQLEDPAATVADLVDAAGGPSGAGIVVEGRLFPADHGLDEVNLHEGARVRFGTRQPAPPAPRRGPVLAVVDGPTAGPTVPLDGTPVQVGRDEGCELRLADPTLSARHATFERAADGTVTVTDCGSHNGTWVDDRPVTATAPVRPGALLRLGATHLRVRADLPDDRPLAVDPLHRAAGGLVAFNRPPRPALPQEPEPITAPEQPAPSTKGRALSIVSIVAPIILGAALVVIYQNPRFALFLLLSPVMAIGNWLSGRRQAKKERRASSKEFRKALETLERELAVAVAEEARRREVLLPDLAEVARRIRQPSTALWQRRPVHADFLRLRAGVGDVPWEPPVDTGRGGPPAEVSDLVEAHATLPRSPVEVDLSRGGVVGVVGDRGAALALARALVLQAAAHHGPADVGVAVLAAAGHVDEWDWAKWLPHARDATGSTRLLAAGREQADALLGALLDSSDEGEQAPMRFQRDDDVPRGRTILYVLDDVSLTQGRRAPARLALRGDAGPAAGIVIAESVDQLPAVTSTVVRATSDLGDVDLHRPQEGTRVDGFVISGVTEPDARDLARTLARYEDPELEVAGAGLPRTVRLLPLLGMEEVDARAVACAWAEGLPDPGPNGPVGLGEDGIVHLDLKTDGPHGLVGGTTGSGKSELLRSMVAGMAARVDPGHLVFVLVDYKGGSAFDECARLPHTVGMVTDLDEHLGERALQSLEAELHHRERLLRDAGAQDLPEYARLGAPRGPLPRLVVVVDEFATLAAELPDFLGALVGIAQRGRSLGVHMILATQRPQGAVNANIKANTNLRIALRVQDAGDSTDVIDRPDAARISRSTPGRAYIRLGPGDVVLAQTALATAGPRARRSEAVRLVPLRFGPLTAPDGGGLDAGEGPTDLARLVAACSEAFERSGLAAPRRPWLPMLETAITLDDVLAAAGDDGERVVFALADEPKRQRRTPVGWAPREGHLGLFGMVGSGTTTGLLAVVRALAERYSPDECHVYGLDFGAGGLAPIAHLAHVGGLVGANDTEGQDRLVRMLRRELDRRRDLDARQLAAEPLVVVAVDGIGAFLAEHETPEAAEVSEAFKRVFADGPTVRMVWALAGDRVGGLPLRLSSLVACKLLFRHADPNEFTAVGIRTKALPEFVPGRAIDAGSQLVVQVGHPGDDLAASVAARAAHPPPARRPTRVGALPRSLELAAVGEPARLEPEPVRLPLGIAEDDLSPAALELHAGDHALVAGPPRSGKTVALMAIAALVRAADEHTVLVGLCDERSALYGYEPLDAAGTLGDLAGVVRASIEDPRRWFILVDDATATEDEEGILADVLRCKRPGLHLIAARRTDDLRSSYSHWTRVVRQSRSGLLLQPNLAADGEVFGLRLPRRVPVSLAPPGRGFVVVAGEWRLAQLGVPAGAS